MELLNEDLNHVINDYRIDESQQANPMWTQYMDAFNTFVQQSETRFERYDAYNEMDNYPEINLALDIISTEMYSFNIIENTPFIIDTNGEIPDITLKKIITDFTDTFNLQEILPIATKNALKYGDAFYFVLKTADDKFAGLRKIENKDIDFIEYNTVGNEVLNYYINVDKIEKSQAHNYLSFVKYQNLIKASESSEVTIATNKGTDYYIIPANRMIRFMNAGQNSKYFPFGESYLEPIFPYWKKVTLLEDSLIIYRIVRAPERRVFYIDVGKAPAKIAEKVVMQTKDEIKRRRTAASQETGKMGITSTFNPLSMQEDYFFAQRADGRGSRVETLAGASNLGEIADVNYFYKKLLASLRVPLSYFNTENPATWNDGKVGSALAEEARFGKWLSRLRHQFIHSFIQLFIDFALERGIKIKRDKLSFRWRESINVEENQELEKMIQRQSVFTGFPTEQFSPFYLQKKVLGWSEEEIQENLTSLRKWTKEYNDMQGG